MKTRILFFTMIAAALSFSCQKESEPAQNGAAENTVVDFVPGPGRILAVSPTGADTKVAFGTANEDGSIPVVWVDQDAIKVYSENNLTGAEYTFEGTNTSSAVFTGAPVEGETRYAVYPATRAKEMKDGKVGVSFADLQQRQLFHSTLKNNSNNLKYMPMWAKETSEGVFTFENLCGAVAFRFNDYQELRGMKITNVTLTSKSMNISGWGYVDPATGEITLYGSDESDRYISVNNDKSTGPFDIANTENKSINDAGKTGFIMALPAGTYPANDLTVTITDNFGRVFERVVTSELVIRPGELRTFPTLSFTFCYGEANCIVISPDTEVTFDITPRYTFEKTLAVDSMKPVKNVNGENFCEGGLKLERRWGIKTGYDKLNAASVLPDTNISLDGNTVTIKGGTSTGNALLVLKDSTETVLWSWHIWSVDCLKEQEYTSCEGTPTFHNINLGATRNVINNLNSVGLYYQYGRKDPFVVSKDFTVVASKPYLSQVELTSTVVRSDENKNMSWTIKNPDTRIISSIPHELSSSGIPSMFVFNDWLAGDSAADNWGNTTAPVTDMASLKAAKGGYKTIYDPCPKGYRVPDMYYFSGLSSVSGGNGKSKTDRGIIYAVQSTQLPDDFPADAATVSDDYAFYPNPGYLNQGTVLVDDKPVENGVILYNKRGYYWTTTNYQSGAAVFSLGNSGTWASNYASHKMSLGSANNIRCMKIQ